MREEPVVLEKRRAAPPATCSRIMVCYEERAVKYMANESAPSKAGRYTGDRAEGSVTINLGTIWITGADLT